ncbi:hypothetical protein KC960_05055 [Candidatus Saccharibacteria bacterium]|nr:hypothetical protein [Candidatus Saccharibacteria bacterium]
MERTISFSDESNLQVASDIIDRHIRAMMGELVKTPAVVNPAITGKSSPKVPAPSRWKLRIAQGQQPERFTDGED